MDIAVIYGDDCYAMTRKLLEELDAAAMIPAGASIAIKPNLVLAKAPEEGATTHPAIAAAVIDYLREHGLDDIFIAEGSWVGADTGPSARIAGFANLCEVMKVPFYDLKRDGFYRKTAAGISIEISKRIYDADFVINLPVLKGHCQTSVTCALKNMKGCISDKSKREFHSLGLHKPIAALNTLIPPQLIIVDGICGDLDFEEGGNPVQAGRIFAGTDPVLVDSYGASLLGYLPGEIEYIVLAKELGVGSILLEDARMVTMGEPTAGANAVSTRRLRQLGQHLEASSACSACYAATIHALARLEEEHLLGRLGEKLYIGQGWRGKSRDNAGIGSCCRGFSCNLPGCPPTALEVLEFIKGDIANQKQKFIV